MGGQSKRRAVRCRRHRRRSAVALVLELALGDPANSKQYSFEVFLAWLIVAYSSGAHTQDRRHLVGIAIGVLTAAVWVAWSFAVSANDQNTVPSVFFAAVAWLA